MDPTIQIPRTHSLGSRTRNCKKKSFQNKEIVVVSETYCLPPYPLKTATWSNMHVGAHVRGHTWNSTTLDRSTTNTQPFPTTATHKQPSKYLYTEHLTQCGRHTKSNSEHLASNRITSLQHHWRASLSVPLSLSLYIYTYTIYISAGPCLQGPPGCEEKDPNCIFQSLASWCLVAVS